MQIYFVLFLVFLFGLSIGSFINCLVWRLHVKKTILGRSLCPRCKKRIAWYDNIPLLSFLILRGRCRNCRGRISWQYPAVELGVGVLFCLSLLINFRFPIFNFSAQGGPALGWQFPIPNIFTFNFLLLVFRDWFLIAAMAIIFLYDLKYYLIPDIIVLPASAIIFLINILLGKDWQNLLISVIIGAGFFLIQFLVSRGKWIGGGDIRLGLLIGASLGWPLVLYAIFLAYILGSIVGIGLLVARKKKWGSKLPFGAFLAPAAIIILFWGVRIAEWYWGVLM